MRFCSIASGSSGNCYYIGTEKCGILIDAGISPRRIKRSLKSLNIELESIYAVLVTHDHHDHVYAVGSLGEQSNIPIYSTSKILAGINKCRKVQPKLYNCCNSFCIEQEFTVGDFTIKAFSVSHDSSECVGYHIKTLKTSFTIATDVGKITDTICTYLKQSDNIIIESNYDEQMLMNGSYPPYLKRRILSDKGHLSNKECSEFIAEHNLPSWKYILFCHMSKDNNTEQKVFEELNNQFTQRGLSLNMFTNYKVLPRRDFYELRF